MYNICGIIEHKARVVSYPPAAHFVIVNTKDVAVTQVADMITKSKKTKEKQPPEE